MGYDPTSQGRSQPSRKSRKACSQSKAKPTKPDDQTSVPVTAAEVEPHLKPRDPPWFLTPPPNKRRDDPAHGSRKGVARPGKGSSENGRARAPKRDGDNPLAGSGVALSADDEDHEDDVEGEEEDDSDEREDDEDDEDDLSDDEADGEAEDSQHQPAADEFVGSEYQPDARVREKTGSFVVVNNWATQITRNTKVAVLLVSTLAYWLGIAKNGKIRPQIKEKGFYWVGKTYKQLAIDMGMIWPKDKRKRKKVKHIIRWGIRSLQEDGIVVVGKDIGTRYPLYLRLSAVEISKRLEAVTVAEEDDDDV